MTTRPRSGDEILLIDRGDLPSLAALVIQPDPARVRVWHLREPGPAGARRAKAAGDHADLIGAELLEDDAWHPRGAGRTVEPALARVVALMQALTVASARKCSKVVWPIVAGPRPAEALRAVDQATGATDLLEVSLPSEEGEPLVIDTPLVDLTDEQVLDLADDAGAPLDAFWPCERDVEGGPCLDSTNTCPSCGRWRHVFETMGLEWPWIAAGVR